MAELKRFRAFLSRGEDPVANFTTWGWRFFSVLMLVLVLAQTAMPTAVYAKGGHGSPPGHGTHFGRSAHPMQQRRGYLFAGPGTVPSPYYYWYSDPFCDYYLSYFNGHYYYYRMPR